MIQLEGLPEITLAPVKTSWNQSEVMSIIDICSNNAIQAEYIIGIIMLIIGIFIGWQYGIGKK